MNEYMRVDVKLHVLISTLDGRGLSGSRSVCFSLGYLEPVVGLFININEFSPFFRAVQ
jgi:hypothetical protein